MKRLSDRFAEAARSAAGLAELGRLLADATDELGFDHFALLDHASLGDAGAGLVRIHNYPASWVEEIVTHGLAPDDPVHLASRRTNIAFRWHELGRLIRLEPRHHAILASSRRFGLGHGLTVPANVPGEPSASCSFAMRVGRGMPRGRLQCAELVGAYALSAARRLRPARARPHLSRREIQCLQLVARGKTDWEIARVLGISEHTARQYVKRARAAYGTVSRTQLAVHGLRDAWISFDEAIPPQW
jgi:LuxR family quorum-sensing system transcriptional regulator CciR